MKTFLVKFLIFSFIGILPLLLLTIGYFYNDPFKVLKEYKDYSNLWVIPNRDFISTRMFIKNYKKYQYDSFIFGSSRTIAFQPQTWKNYISADAKPFMFDASSESIYGVWSKIKFIDSLHSKIKNAVIIICRDVSFANSSNHKGHLFIKDPLVSGESNFAFHFDFFKAYFDPVFLFNFYDYKFSNTYKPFMKGYIEDRKISIDTITNSIKIINREAEIISRPAEYFAKRKDIFFNRGIELIDTVARIKNVHLNMLKEIKRIFEKNKTDYRIILSPLYEQTKFNPVDKKILTDLFGNKLFDFSGKNHFTDPITNYYETSHFRPIVGDSIFSIIYKN